MSNSFLMEEHFNSTVLDNQCPNLVENYNETTTTTAHSLWDSPNLFTVTMLFIIDAFGVGFNVLHVSPFLNYEFLPL